MKNIFVITLLMSSVALAFGQSYNLQKLLKDKKLIVQKNAEPLTGGNRKGISSNGLTWLDGVNFSTGTIEVDLRGKDEPQRSFLGIAFHGVDTITYDAIYFRPFNFRSTDPIKKIHAVQYISHPEFTWRKLREEKNGIYEKGIDPPPLASDWFHAKIVVTEAKISVYVNNSDSPSLEVNKLNDRKDGWIGLWNFDLPGEFANLVIKK